MKQQWVQRSKQRALQLRQHRQQGLEEDAKKRRIALVQQKRQPQLNGLPSDWERWETDQVVEIDRLLQAQQPWEVLGLPESATPEQCTRVFRKLSAVVHPDKCAHPLAAEAFKKLCEAQQGWGQNRQDWHAEQLAKAAAAMQREQAEEWERQGGRLKWWGYTDALKQLYIEAEESYWYIHGTEVADWLRMMLQGANGVPK